MKIAMLLTPYNLCITIMITRSCIYTGLAVAAGKLNPDYVPNLKLTNPVFSVGPHDSWADPKKVASIDPFGHVSRLCIEWEHAIPR
jgi:hypothetical protein